MTTPQDAASEPPGLPDQRSCRTTCISGLSPTAPRWQTLILGCLAALVVCTHFRGSVAAEAAAFTITRPHASLRATLATSGDFSVRTDRLPLPTDGGSYPFAEVVSAPNQRHLLLSVCTASPTDENHGSMAIDRTAAGWQITGTHRGLKVDVGLEFSAASLPALRL
jgi:hypothetical protein